MADVYFQCLTTLVMGGNGLSRPGFRVWGSSHASNDNSPSRAENRDHHTTDIGCGIEYVTVCSKFDLVWRALKF